MSTYTYLACEACACYTPLAWLGGEGGTNHHLMAGADTHVAVFVEAHFDHLDRLRVLQEADTRLDAYRDTNDEDDEDEPPESVGPTA